MKFGKKLKIQIQETLPEWQDKFLCYKDLKKLVHLISSVPLVTSTLARRRFSDDQSSLEKVEAEFVYLLNIEIEKSNAFFMEQEEDFIIRHEEFIQEQITRVLLERLIVNRPHPWGLLITFISFIELIKNPRYSFWTRSFPRCAPEIENLFESVSRSCGGPKAEGYLTAHIDSKIWVMHCCK